MNHSEPRQGPAIFPKNAAIWRDVLVPAAAAAILGGVSLGGGSGRPLGIATGALILAVLRSGLNAVEAPPFVNDIAMGAILLTVAILDGSYLMRRVSWAARRVRGPGFK
jgi:ribose/xylose/arabinose/galactoside ABC-type transport system permease subunit